MSDLLVFGLGNPGEEYEFTYHNAGLIALSHMREKLEKEVHAAIKAGHSFAYWKYGHLILAAASPAAEIFMNNSGLPVRETLGFFKLAPERLVVLHDDSDLPVGEFKLEFGRGAAGHHGVESVIKELGTQEFWRGRIGIRPAEEGHRRKAEEFVLKNIKKEDAETLNQVFQMLETKVMEKV